MITQAGIDALRALLSPGDAAIDIGAHTGDTTLPMALAVGCGGCVLALEPNPYVFAVLQQNAGLNPHKTNIVPLPFAATVADGEYEFEYSDPGFCNGGFIKGQCSWQHAHAFKLKVQGRNLVAYLRREHPDFLPRIRYIKIDAEGYDCEILESLAELVSAEKPYLRTEVFNHSSLAQHLQLYRTVTILGYHVHRFDDDAHYRGPLLAENDFTAARGFDIFCEPRS
jgi:FkbM family methyltransferase